MRCRPEIEPRPHEHPAHPGALGRCAVWGLNPRRPILVLGQANVLSTRPPPLCSFRYCRTAGRVSPSCPFSPATLRSRSIVRATTVPIHGFLGRRINGISGTTVSFTHFEECASVNFFYFLPAQELAYQRMQLVELNHQLETAQQQIQLRDELITERGLVLVNADGSQTLTSMTTDHITTDVGASLFKRPHTPVLNGGAANSANTSSAGSEKGAGGGGGNAGTSFSHTFLSVENVKALKQIDGQDIGTSDTLLCWFYQMAGTLHEYSGLFSSVVGILKTTTLGLTN